jgi:2-methylcitrate dehydratase PrpD
MQDIENFGDALIAFAYEDMQKEISPFYVDTFLNWYGCALAGSRQTAVERTISFYVMDAPSELLPPIGRAEHISASASIAIDCLSSACLAYDDINFETTLHPAGPVAAAILGLSRCRPISGSEALRALRLGMEIECRVALVLFNRGTEAAEGWYPTGIAGGIGAAAALGRLLGFDEARLRTAVGIAAARASGTRGTHKSMASYYVPGLAAASGYISARLAEAGLSCGMSSLTGGKGLIRQIAPKPDIEIGMDRLGSYYACEATSCKPYPYGFVAHAVIKCCRDLHKKMLEEGRRLRKLVVHVSPTAASIGGDHEPENVYDAQISLSYIAARVLRDPAQAFEPVDENFSIDEETALIARQVSVAGNRNLQNEQARLFATFEDGGECEIYCGVAPGAPGNLLDSAMIRKKFLRLASGIIGRENAQGRLDTLCNIHNIDNISDILTLR